MTQSHVLSIVTTSLNSEEFIEDCIRSVAEQDYLNIEYVVVDGGSTDSTLEILERYFEFIDVSISEPDDGIADAFNKGVGLSSGDYIMFLNSDDKLHHPKAISLLMAAIDRNTLPTFVYGDCQIINRCTSDLVYTVSVEYQRSKFLMGRTLPHPSLITHRRYFDRYGLFDASFKIAMDYEFLLRGINHESIVHIPEIVTDMRDGGVSTTTRGKTVDEIIRALKKNGYLRSFFSEFGLRSYYALRGFASIFKNMFLSYGRSV